VAGDVLEEGDVMRWDAELVKQLQASEDRDVLVRVQAIERQDDGTVQLRLEPADALPDWKVAS
jgi:hypothetical protein